MLTETPAEKRATKRSAASPVEMAAEKLIRHIKASGLKPGDRYLSAEQAGQLLGSSVMTVQRAMTLLAREKILDRRPRAGTFIGNHASLGTEKGCVHFFMPEQFASQTEGRESYWDLLPDQILGIQSVLPHVSVQFNFIPNQDVAYTQQIVEQMTVAGSLRGAILILHSREMRAFFNQSGIPTVVEGGVEADLGNLCWVQWDQVQTGYLLASHLLQRGHRRLCTIMRDVWSIGESLLHDGIGEAIAAAGLSSNTLRMRSTPSKVSAITELVRGLLTTEANPPTGFICRNEFQANHVSKVVDSLGLSHQVEVVLCNAPSQQGQAKYTYAAPEIGPFETGVIVGTMLKELGQGVSPTPRGREVAVRLEIAPTGES